jgi:transcriptional regulator with XRE-family HTH domain
METKPLSLKLFRQSEGITVAELLAALGECDPSRIVGVEMRDERGITFFGSLSHLKCSSNSAQLESRIRWYEVLDYSGERQYIKEQFEGCTYELEEDEE